MTEAFNRSDIAPTGRRRPRSGLGRRRRTGSKRPRRTPTPRRKRFWQRSSWYRRAASATNPWPSRSSWTTSPRRARSTPTNVDGSRGGRQIDGSGAIEDERFAYFAEASIVFLDLPDAVFRGYEGDDELLGMPRDDDDAPSRSSFARRSYPGLPGAPAPTCAGCRHHIGSSPRTRVRPTPWTRRVTPTEQRSDRGDAVARGGRRSPRCDDGGHRGAVRGGVGRQPVRAPAAGLPPRSGGRRGDDWRRCSASTPSG